MDKSKGNFTWVFVELIQWPVTYPQCPNFQKLAPHKKYFKPNQTRLRRRGGKNKSVGYLQSLEELLQQSLHGKLL